MPGCEQKTLTFTSRTTRLLLEPFDAKGQDLESASVSLDAELQTALQKYPSIKVSSSTLEELQRHREDIRNIEPGPAKSDLENQYAVDYIITGAVLPA